MQEKDKDIRYVSKSIQNVVDKLPNTKQKINTDDEISNCTSLFQNILDEIAYED